MGKKITPRHFPKRPQFRVTDSDGRVIRPGDTVTDFRGETATFKMVSREPLPGKDAKVVTEERLGENYASVFGLTAEIVAED